MRRWQHRSRPVAPVGVRRLDLRLRFDRLLYFLLGDGGVVGCGRRPGSGRRVLGAALEETSERHVENEVRRCCRVNPGAVFAR